MNLSKELTEIITNQSKTGSVSIKSLVEHFGSRSLAFLIIILSLPIALPFTPPGINTPVAVVCIIISIQMILSKKTVYLPNWIGNKNLPFKPDGGFFKALTKMLEFVENITKERLAAFTTSKYTQFFLGFGVLSSSIIMLLPLPIINSLSSFLVLLTAVGIVTKDGLVAFIGAFISVTLLLGIIILTIYSLKFGLSIDPKQLLKR